jgi:hypothetical protein
MIARRIAQSPKDKGTMPLHIAMRIGRAGQDKVEPRDHPNCLIPWFDGFILSKEWKEALWDKFVTGAPRSSQHGAIGSSPLARARRQSSNNEGQPAMGSRDSPIDRKLGSRS